MIAEGGMACTLRENSLSQSKMDISSNLIYPAPAAAFAGFLAFLLTAVAQNDWEWTWANPSPPGYHFNGAAMGDSRLVIVGAHGMSAMRESEGEWSVRNTGVRDTLTDVIWTGEEFVAVGGGGTVVTSPDGDSWTSYASGTSARLQAIASTGSQLVAVGSKDTIITSSDGGKQWKVRHENPDSYRGFAEIVWTGEQLVAVGGPGIITSPDGVHWEEQEVATTVSFNTVTWTGSRVVAFEENSSVYVIASSADGLNWSVSEVDGLYLSPRSIVWTGERFVVAGEGRYATSSDLENWQIHGPSPFGSFHDLLWTGTELLGISNRGLWSSLDGIEWTDQGTGLLRDGFWESVTWASTQWVATGRDGAIATSPNGHDWTLRESGVTVTISSVAWTGSFLLAVCLDGTVLMSSDGESWEQRDPGLYRWSLNGVAWSGSEFVAGGPKGLIRSEDGINWDIQLEGNYLIMDVIWTGSGFAAISYWGGVRQSIDGRTWISRPGVQGGNAITWTGSHLVVVGDQIAVFGDDEVWRIEDIPAPFYGVVTGGDEVVAVAGGTIWTSFDLKQWRPDPSFESGGNFFSFFDAAWNGEKLVIVGSGGAILTGVPREFEGERTFATWMGDHDLSDLPDALVDYAMGAISPVEADRRYRPRMISGDSESSEFSFTRNINRQDLMFDVQVTTDFVNWIAIAKFKAGHWTEVAPDIVLSESPIENSGLRKVVVERPVDPAPGPPTEKQFFRLRIEH